MEHNRRVYSLLDFLGDIGGVVEVLAAMFGFFLYPLAEFMFILDATKHIFLARTSDASLFLPRSDQKVIVEDLAVG